MAVGDQDGRGNEDLEYLIPRARICTMRGRRIPRQHDSAGWCRERRPIGDVVCLELVSGARLKNHGHDATKLGKRQYRLTIDFLQCTRGLEAV